MNNTAAVAASAAFAASASDSSHPFQNFLCTRVFFFFFFLGCFAQKSSKRKSDFWFRFLEEREVLKRKRERETEILIFS